MDIPITAAEMTTKVLSIIADGDTPTRDMIDAELSLWEKKIRLDQLKTDQALAQKVIKETFSNED